MSAQRGFSLIEVVVALSLAALSVLIAHATFAATADFSAREAALERAETRQANARRFLATAIGSLEVAQTPGGSFAGTSDTVAFTTWQATPEGATERRRLVLRLVLSQLVAISEHDTLSLVDDVDSVALDYLMDLGANAVWQAGWTSPATAPLAIRIRLRRSQPDSKCDTLLFLAGARG